MGAGSVFLTDFSRYILADINSDLIGLYNIVKLRTDEYVAAAREMFTRKITSLSATTCIVMNLTKRIRCVARCCSCI